MKVSKLRLVVLVLFVVTVVYAVALASRCSRRCWHGQLSYSPFFTAILLKKERKEIKNE